MNENTTDTESETSPVNTVANIAVLTFAIIGAVQTTKFAVLKTRDAIRYVKAVRASGQPVPDEN